MVDNNKHKWSKTKFLASLNSDAKELFEIWLNSGGYSVKMTSYFSTYAELLSAYRNKECTLVEIGVLEGSSLSMWREWLGDKARIIGIDLNPAAKSLEKKGFEIFIGNQADTNFWKKFYSKVGKIDVLIDDGGHQSFQQIMTIYCGVCNLNSESLIIVEDTATSFYSSMTHYHKKNSFLQFTKDATDILTVKEKEFSQQDWQSGVNQTILKVFKNIESIKFFSGIVAYKINPQSSLPSVAVNNCKSKKEHKQVLSNPEIANDFRNIGNINGIEIEWPNPFEQTIRKVEGESVNLKQKIMKIKLK